MGDTAISWTDKTWNCIRGCSRVSAGCMRCYAERQALRFAGPGGAYDGLVTKRLKVVNADEPDKDNYVEPQWTGKVVFDESHLCDPLRWGKPCRVFVNSMSDIFHESLTNEQIAAMFGVMAAAKQHTFQILTKRAKRMRQWFFWIEQESKTCNGGVGMTPAARCFIEAQKRDSYFTLDGKLSPLRRHHVAEAALSSAWPLPNVWQGVSTENQATAADRIAELLTVPAAVRFISAEPLLGEISLWAFLSGELRDQALLKLGQPQGLPGLDWVIAGCESGPRARKCDVAWLRLLRDECAAAGVPFFLKQAEESADLGLDRQLDIGDDDSVAFGDGSKLKPRLKDGNHVVELPYLDGVQHAEFPA
jgi:protein gp37